MSNVRTDHIFTNILMQHGRKPVEDLDLKRKERLRLYGQISGKKIKSSQEIFISADGKHPKSVLVTGKAGIGKTLFCQKLIRDWADNKLFRSRANAEVPDLKFAYLLTFCQLNLLGDDPVTLKDILNRSSVLDDRSNIDDSIFEYIVEKKNNPLPVKTSDLYDEVVNMFVQKHDRKKRLSVEKTLDELSKLAAQLLEERKFLFLKEDLKTLNLHEVESLCGSGLLHCGPPLRT